MQALAPAAGHGGSEGDLASTAITGDGLAPSATTPMMSRRSPRAATTPEPRCASICSVCIKGTVGEAGLGPSYAVG